MGQQNNTGSRDGPHEERKKEALYIQWLDQASVMNKDRRTAISDSLKKTQHGNHTANYKETEVQ